MGTSAQDTPFSETAVRMLLEGLGEDPDRHGLKDTPERVVKAWQEMTCGYQTNARDAIGRAVFIEPDISSAYNGSGIVCVGNITFSSISPETLLPYYGRCNIAYVPCGDAVLGLSKFARLLHVYSKRIQTQEMLTTTVMEAVDAESKPKGVAVIIEAQHLQYRSPLQPPVVTFSSNGMLKETGKIQEELKTVFLLNGFPGMDASTKHCSSKDELDGKNLKEDLCVPPEGQAAYSAMKNFFLNLGLYERVEGIELGLKTYVLELLHATSGGGDGAMLTSGEKESSLTDGVTTGLCNGSDVPSTAGNGEEDKMENPPATGASISQQINPSRINGSGDSSSNVAESCVQDIQHQIYGACPPVAIQEPQFLELCSPFQSTCEHHLLPFHGYMYVGYVPRQSHCDVSVRVVEKIVSKYSLRLQIQERIASQVADEMEQVMDLSDLVVVAAAHHMCMIARGVQAHSSTTAATVARGKENTSFLLNRAATELRKHYK